MHKSFIMLGLICLLASVMMANFIIVIPKFGSKYFGAPDDIKEMVKDMPDKPMWVNMIGVFIMIAGFIGVIAIFVWAIADIINTQMSFFEALVRFLIITEGYKLYDIIFFDYFMLTKFKLPAKIYPQTIGAKGYDNFGFNAKSQINKLVLFFFLSLALVFGSTSIIG